MNEENVNLVETLEADVNGGWLLHHFTRTWLTREPLSVFDQRVADAQAQVDAAQANLVAVQAQAVQFKQEIEAAKATAADLGAAAGAATASSTSN